MRGVGPSRGEVERVCMIAGRRDGVLMKAIGWDRMGMRRSGVGRERVRVIPDR